MVYFSPGCLWVLWSLFLYVVYKMVSVYHVKWARQLFISHMQPLNMFVWHRRKLTGNTPPLLLTSRCERLDWLAPSSSTRRGSAPTSAWTSWSCWRMAWRRSATGRSPPAPTTPAATARRSERSSTASGTRRSRSLWLWWVGLCFCFSVSVWILTIYRLVCFTALQKAGYSLTEC